MVAACLVVVLAAGPSIDTYVCRDDLAAPVATTLEAQPAVASAAIGDVDGAEKHGAGVCLHGHCHHAAAFGVATTDVSGWEPLNTRLDYLPADQRHPSQGLPRLERPPRA